MEGEIMQVIVPGKITFCLSPDVKKSIDCRRGDDEVLVIGATPEILLECAACDSEALRSYVHKYFSEQSLWKYSLEPLMTAVLNHKLASAMSKDTAVLIIYGHQWKPVINFDHDEARWTKEIDMASRQNIAFMRIGAATRGTPVCRDGTRITPEGLGFVKKTIHGTDWKACEIPPDGHKCCLVLITRNGNMADGFFFDRRDGTLLLNGTRTFCAKQETSPNRATVLDCVFNPVTDVVKILDGRIVQDLDITGKPLGSRLSAAAMELSNWCIISDGGLSKNMVVLPYAPPVGLIRVQTAKSILFVCESAPYATHSGSKAFLWKQPTLSAEEAVLVCREHRVLAQSVRDSCILVDVGSLLYSAPKRMYAMVCRPTPDGSMWKWIREAHRSERLFTVDEALLIFSGMAVDTQVTRSSVTILLYQLTRSPEVVSTKKKFV
jgi:hypothetical protein